MTALNYIFWPCVIFMTIILIGCKEQYFVIKSVAPELQQDFDWILSKFDSAGINWNPDGFGWDFRVADLEGKKCGNWIIEEGTLIITVDPGGEAPTAMIMLHELAHYHGLDHDIELKDGTNVIILASNKNFVILWAYLKNEWTDDLLTAIIERRE